jgi:kelch-like protein 20
MGDLSCTTLDRTSSPARLPYFSEKHPSHVLDEIQRLKKHQELCDVCLLVGSRRIFAHRVILSACSPYFRAMFTGDLSESKLPEVTIRDVDENAMELLIEFCYSSKIIVEESNVQSLLPAGQYFFFFTRSAIHRLQIAMCVKRKIRSQKFERLKIQ